jgi:formylglycine-generating enzyme required for sulfatase activity
MRRKDHRSILFSSAAVILTACSASPGYIELPGAVEARLAEADGMLQVLVPEGGFLMGSREPDAPEDETPQHRVHLDAFWIDRTEITNSMYAACVESGACQPLVSPRIDIDDHPDFPVQGVAWPEAAAYCQWVGRRLPTEAEWEKAARGSDGRLYPWGNEPPDETRANFGKQSSDVVDVGSYAEGASPYGALDMAGNVYEWVADWYGETYYAESPVQNPPGPERTLVKVVRGGAWNGSLDTLRSANRFWAFPGRNDYDGFRCAEDAD